MRRNVAGDLYDVFLADLFAGRVRSTQEYEEIRVALRRLSIEEEMADERRAREAD